MKPIDNILAILASHTENLERLADATNKLSSWAETSSKIQIEALRDLTNRITALEANKHKHHVFHEGFCINCRIMSSNPDADKPCQKVDTVIEEVTTRLQLMKLVKEDAAEKYFSQTHTLTSGTDGVQECTVCGAAKESEAGRKPCPGKMPLES